MQADQIGVNLLAHTQEGVHEGGADLAAEETAHLQQRAAGDVVSVAQQASADRCSLILELRFDKSAPLIRRRDVVISLDDDRPTVLTFQIPLPTATFSLDDLARR
jgi:hypothetical protein